MHDAESSKIGGMYNPSHISLLFCVIYGKIPILGFHDTCQPFPKVNNSVCRVSLRSVERRLRLGVKDTDTSIVFDEDV